MQTILAVDDEFSVRESYRVILSDDYRVLLADQADVALECLETKHIDLVLLDLTMPGMSGMEFLRRLEELGGGVPVIVVTGSNSVDAAVKAMKRGAREFVIKPFDVDDLLCLVERTLKEERQHRELRSLRESDAAGFEHIVGDSPAIQTMIAQARQAMQVDSTVLITGETGTGKDVLARAVHYGGGRSEKPYVPLACCAIPQSLVESELFGHVKGSFTGATESREGKMKVADGGTLFLDEIGEMPMEAQSSLLRVLQDGCFYPVGDSKVIEVDVRFICATNRDLPSAISQGIFREDLYYRINVLPIVVPPLRKRRADIPRLIAHFIALHGPRVNSKVRDFSQPALARLMAYHWPGNVRELENAIERILVCFSAERVIRPEFLDGMFPREREAQEDVFDSFEGLPLQEATQRLEKRMICEALERCDWVQSQAAEALGTTRRILKYKMDQLGIDENGGAQSIAS